MNVIIVGAGKVGFTLSEHLSQEDHNVTIIDTNDAALRRASETLDVMCVKGSGASPSTLEEAGVAGADVFIAVSGLDELNMICCLTAKRLGAKYTIARVRSVEYAADLEPLKRGLGIDLVINPENATALEIAQLLRFPTAANLETFYRGAVELIGFRVRPEDFLVGQPLSAQRRRFQELPMLFCAAERENGEVVIPDGAFVPQAGDRLYLIGRSDGLSAFFRLLGRHTPKSRSVLIIGGGRITYYLAGMLEKQGIRVKIIEQDMKRCRHLSEMLPKAAVICGDGTDHELLEEENVTAYDAFVALTDRDEDNLIISLYAMQQGIPKVVAKSNRQNYTPIARAAGLDSVLSPKLITAGQILQAVRGMQNSKGSVMTALYKIADGNAEAMEFLANDTTANTLLNLIIRRYGYLPKEYCIVGFDNSPTSREGPIMALTRSATSSEIFWATRISEPMGRWGPYPSVAPTGMITVSQLFFRSANSAPPQAVRPRPPASAPVRARSSGVRKSEKTRPPAAALARSSRIRFSRLSSMA